MVSVKGGSVNGENGVSVKHYRAGFSLFLISQAVVFMVLIAVRYLIAGGKVGPYSQSLGVVITVVMLISAWLAYSARKAAEHDNGQAIQTRLTGAFWLGVLAFALVLIMWTLVKNAGYSVTLPSLEVFWVGTGFWLVYVLLGLFLLFAARSRGRLVGYTPAQHWDLEASSHFWNLVTAGWIALWIVFFLL